MALTCNWCGKDIKEGKGVNDGGFWTLTWYCSQKCKHEEAKAKDGNGKGGEK